MNARRMNAGPAGNQRNARAEIAAAAFLDDISRNAHVAEDCGNRNAVSSENCHNRNGAGLRFPQTVQMDIEEIREALKAPGKTQVGLAKAMGVDPAAVSRMLDGRRLIKAHELPKIRAYFGRSEDDEPARGGVIPLGRRAADPVLHPGDWPRDVPVLGAAAAGADGRFDFNGQTVDHVRRPPRLAGVRDAYALYVLGESMKPWRENGALIYVHPHLPPNIGDYVVVQIHAAEGEPPSGYVKQLVRRTPAELRLHQFNEARDIIIPARKVVSIHRVIDWSELLGL